eukprot:scaffold306521_cov32-Tisochrysis_lutea.AAC.3
MLWVHLVGSERSCSPRVSATHGCDQTPTALRGVAPTFSAAAMDRGAPWRAVARPDDAFAVTCLIGRSEQDRGCGGHERLGGGQGRGAVGEEGRAARAL